MSADNLSRLAQELLDGVTAQSAAEIPQNPAPPARAPTMGKIAKINYSHDAMIDMILANPGVSQNTLAAAFGYSPGWISNVMASDAWQARLAERRKEVVDPILFATLEERVRGLTLRAAEVLQEKLAAPAVSDTVALRAFELGAKAMGMGGNAAPKIVPIDLSVLADRLLALKGGGQGLPALEGQSRVVNE